MARVVTFFFILMATVTGSVQMHKLINSEDIRTNISHMVASRHGDIYVGTMNTIYHLNSELRQISYVVIERFPERDNFVNVLFLVENFTTHVSLMTCAFFSGCQMRNLKNISMYSKIKPCKKRDDIQGTQRQPDPILLSGDGCIRMGSTYDLLDLYLTEGFSKAKLSEDRLTRCDISKSIIDFNNKEFVKLVKNFVYGFSFGRLDYYFTNQEPYGPIVSKLCQMKKSAYSEMPIRCSGVEYKILKSMQYTSFNQTDGLLVGVFTNADDSRSAVCLFKYSNFQNVMLENIKMCFNGTSYWKEYIKTNESCTKVNDTLSNNELLCTQLERQPIVIGNIAADGEVIGYDGNNSFNPLAAVGVVHISRRTLVLLGSLTGQVDEIIQNTNGSWSRLNSFDLGTSSKIGKDILFDPGRRHFYVFSKSKIFKYQLHNCDEYKYCHSCLTPGNHPVCGWCVLRNKCGILEDCESTIWLQGPADSECPVVKNISPPTFNINSTKRHLKIQLNHQLPNVSNYFYKLSCSGDEFPANITTDTVSCDLPSLLNYSSLSDEGTGLILVNVSIFSNWSADPVVSGMLTVYDCSHVTRCTQCTRTDFSCAWCITRNKCINDYGLCSDGDKMVKNTDECPIINVNKTGVISVPSRIQDVFRYIHGVNFPDGTYKCKLNLGDEYGVGERLNSTMVRCKFHINTTLIDSKGVIDVCMKLLLVPNISIEINNTSEIKVIIYQCEYLAGDDCSLCKSYTILYECRWCGNTCQYGNKTSCTENDCPSPSITKVTPLTAHFNASTVITIEGQNLGIKFADVSNSVTVGRKRCSPIEKEYLPSKRIVCRLEPFGNTTRVNVTVSIPGKENVNFSEQYSFQKPIITKISPNIGPKSGGSLVRITGESLDTGNNVSVTIGDIICRDFRQETSSSVTCVTEANRGNVLAHTVSMNFSGVLEIGENVTFEYKDDPTIWNITPLKSFNGGGRKIIITGEDLYIIQQPKIYLVYNNGTETPPRVCANVNSTAIVCPSPRNIYKSTEDTKPRVAFKMDKVQSVTNVTKHFPNVSSVITYLDDPSITPFETPVTNKEILIIKGSNLTDAADKGDITVLVGNGACTVIALNNDEILCRPPSDRPEGAGCDNSIEDQQKSMSVYDIKIIVKIGDISFNAGCLRYGSESDEQSNLFIIVTAVAAVFLVVVLSIVCGCVVIKRKTTKQKKDFMLQMDRIEGEVRNQCREGRFQKHVENVHGAVCAQ